MSFKKKSRRIRKPDSSSEDEAGRTSQDPAEYHSSFNRNKNPSAARRILSSDEDESSNDSNTDMNDEDKDDDSSNSFIDDSNDNDSNEDKTGGVDQENWMEMMERLRRRDDKYQGLTSQYEESVLDSRVSGSRYDVSDEEEERINKYPEKLLLCLREAVVDAHKDDEKAVPEEVENNDTLIQMWEMYDYREDKEKGGECVCGQVGLRHLFFMRQKQTESWPWHTRIVGSECIKWFIKSNAQPNLGVMFRLLKDGVVATFNNRLDSNRLEFSLGGNILPPVLLQHRNDHVTDYKLPITISSSDIITMVVSPLSSASSAKITDDTGQLIKRGKKYRVFTKPYFKPSKDLSKIPSVDFLLVKVVNLEVTKNDPASSSQYKAENYIKN